MKRTNRRTAFTKLELAIVVVIVLIMAALTRPDIQFNLDRSRIARARSDMRYIQTAIEAYFADHQAYPHYTLNQSYDSSDGKLNTFTTTAIPTLFSGNAETAGLTTPIAYTTSLNRDPFAPQKSISFAYHTDHAKQGWILFSPGPDRRYDILPSEDYDSSITQPSAKLLLKTYDPTNGQRSAGDLYRLKQ